MASNLIEISDEVVEILEVQAKRFHCTQKKFLEAAIKDYRDSSTKEHLNQIERRNMARADFLRDFPKSNKERVWNVAYNTGWTHFQVRHDAIRELHPAMKAKDSYYAASSYVTKTDKQKDGRIKVKAKK